MNRIALWFCFSLVIGRLALSQLVAAETNFIWIEAEKPTSANFDVTINEDNPGLLSGGQRLIKIIDKKHLAKDLPSEGLSLRYKFDVDTSGVHEVWARLGFEQARAPMEWRLDQGAWTELSNTELTTNVMEISNWNSMSWICLGKTKLAKGKRTLEIRLLKATKNRFMFSLDCFAIVEGEGGFVPEGVLNPGENYNAEVDQQAAAHVFRFAEGDLKAAPSRLELPLDGLWQAARYDDPDLDVQPYVAVQEIPKNEAYPLRWMGIAVPGNAFENRPEMMFGHRFFYQTKIDVPQVLDGRGFYLHFSGTTWIVSVFVNGQLCGEHQSVLVPWDLDISRAIKPGTVNTIAIGVKTSAYGTDGKTPTAVFSRNDYRDYPRRGKFPSALRYVDTFIPTTKGEGHGLDVGIVNPVKLVVAGAPYSADVFVKTSVAKNRLDAEIEIRNPGKTAAEVEIRCEAVLEKTGKVEKTFGPTKLSLPAGEVKMQTVGGEWLNPKLWWPAESASEKPDCYLLRTVILVNGKPVDQRDDLFGFREVTIEGRNILLNGLRWHFWNWVEVKDKSKTKEGWLDSYFAEGDRYQRFGYDTDDWLETRENALDFYDRNGVPGRLSTCIDGMFITTNPTNPVTWKNFENHVRQVTRAYRNHPSIFNWSLGNEYLLVTCRLQFGGIYEKCEQNFAKLCQVVKDLDPTRASFEDGAGDLGGLSEINCQHYAWKTLLNVPYSLYDYPTGPATSPRPRGGFDFETRRRLYQWDGKRPLFLGEEFYYAGSGTMAWFGGPEVYRSKQHQDLAAARYARMGIEGARWQDVAGIFPWTRELPGAKKSFEPRAVFVREHDSCFYPGSTLKRTIGIFNDGRSRDPLTLKWRLIFNGKESSHGEKTYTIEPGCHADDILTTKLPASQTRLDGELQLELLAGGQQVFVDTRKVSVVPLPQTETKLNTNNFALFDPAGTVAKWLEAHGQSFARVDSLAAPATTVKCLLIGPGALSDELRLTAAPTLREFVQKGGTLLVLEQQSLLQKDDLPVQGVSLNDGSRDKELAKMAEFQKVRGNSGALSFPVALAHPVLSNIERDDLFTWAGGGENYRLSYDTPTSGAICLIQAGEDLCLTPMLELPVGSGSYLLSQTLVGEKLGISPTADQLLWNMLAWAGARAGTIPGKTMVYSSGDKALTELLDGINLVYTKAENPAAALTGGGKVVVIRATEVALKALNAKKAELQAFCKQGGWLMIVGLTSDGLEDFNNLVGFAHRLRPFRVEAARLRNYEDQLLLGLSDREFTQFGDTVIAPWANLKAVSSKVFTQVVDGEDVASFASCEYPRVTDGLTRADFWKYTQYFNSDGSGILEFKFDRPETLTGMNIWADDSYFFPKDIEVIFDDHTTKLFTLEESSGKQSLDIDTITTASVTIKLLNHYPNPECEKDLVEIDEVELLRKEPDDFDKRVVFLSKPGGLVKYPMDKGGILLNQIDYAVKDSSQNQKNKCTVFANLLRNMGAAFKNGVK